MQEDAGLYSCLCILPGSEQRQGNLVGPMGQEYFAFTEPRVRDVLLQGVFLYVRDAVFLAVILSEDKAREDALAREIDELLVENGVFPEMRQIALQAAGRNLIVQA